MIDLDEIESSLDIKARESQPWREGRVGAGEPPAAVGPRRVGPARRDAARVDRVDQVHATRARRLREAAAG